MSMVTIRQWHAYLGLFIAPSVLFFALTGALQIFGLHEAHGNYQPLLIVEKLSKVHKDQVFAASHHHEAPPTADADAPPAAADDDDDKPALSTVCLKWFFLFVALALAVSTGFGLWMGLTQTRRKRRSWGLVVAGALVPVILLIV
jgi:hypothetical protein